MTGAGPTHLPTGTITFVLTDIEGSTVLWERHGEAMGVSVERHEAIIATAVESNDGIVVRSRGEGDSCFCVFGSAINAVRAGADIQSALAREPWDGPAIKVRVAIHTGTAELRDGQYYGSVVNRCARLRGCGHGGQALVSSTTAALVRDALRPGTSLRDLGAHRLPDLAQPERIYQLCPEGLPDTFPALASLDALPNNLPIQLTRFVGRERELAELAALLEERRLVTLTGPGGSGKTRLAAQTAAGRLESFPDGVWLVPLGAIDDSELVTTQLASTLGLREEPGRALADTVTSYLGRRCVLIVLDNCEHLLAGAASLATAILASCPNVKILATSRQALGIEGEVARPVSPLSFPDTGVSAGRDELLAFESVQLLQDRAGLARPEFSVTEQNAAAVATICRQLDGIPLAIELAAARLGSLGPAELGRRLDDRFRLLSSERHGVPARHQTLEAAVDWSYELLADDERLLFRRLAVFVGRFTLDAAEAVGAGGDLARGAIAQLLAGLVDRSLVSADTQEATTSYRMLSTIRAFALSRLETSGEEAEARGRHLHWLVGLAEEAEPELVEADQARWFDVLSVAHDDVRSALSWGMQTDPAAALRLTAALGQFWDTRGHWTEGRRWLEESLLAAPDHTREWGRAMSLAGNLAHEQGDNVAARAMLERALEVQESIGDEEGAVLTLTRVGSAAAAAGETSVARGYFDRGLAMIRERGYERRSVGLLMNLAMSAHARGDRTARSLYEEALSLSREHGHKRGIAGSLVGLGNLAQAAGDLDGARSAYEESLALSRELGDKRGVATTLSNLAVTARARGEFDRASQLLAEALPLHRELGDRRAIALALSRLGTVARVREDLPAAAHHHREALSAFRELGDSVGVVLSLVSLGRVARAEGDTTTAVVWLRQALDACARAPELRSTATCLEELAGLLVSEDPVRAAVIFGAAEAIRRASGGTGPRSGQASYDADLASLRERLAGAELERAWTQGAEMSPGEAVGYASASDRHLSVP